MASTVTIDLRHVARGLDIPLRQIQAIVELLDEGNTVPFITRYRKDQTGGLDEEQIREIQGRLTKMRLLADRKQTILRSIESQGKLTEKLAKQILAATTTKRLEDLYLPYKPKKQTLATLARSRGLEPLAREILDAAPGCADLDARARDFVNPDRQVPTGGRCPVGRRPHPGRAVQRAGRAAAAAPRDPAADRRARQHADRRSKPSRRQPPKQPNDGSAAAAEPQVSSRRRSRRSRRRRPHAAVAPSRPHWSADRSDSTAEPNACRAVAEPTAGRDDRCRAAAAADRDGCGATPQRRPPAVGRASRCGACRSAVGAAAAAARPSRRPTPPPAAAEPPPAEPPPPPAPPPPPVGREREGQGRDSKHKKELKKKKARRAAASRPSATTSTTARRSRRSRRIACWPSIAASGPRCCG